MTPEELRAYAQVMKAEGMYKVEVRTGRDLLLSIEMSQVAIAAAHADHATRAAPSPTQPAPPAEGDEDDPFAYAATEGLPG